VRAASTKAPGPSGRAGNEQAVAPFDEVGELPGTSESDDGRPAAEAPPSTDGATAFEKRRQGTSKRRNRVDRSTGAPPLSSRVASPSRAVRSSAMSARPPRGGAGHRGRTHGAGVRALGRARRGPRRHASARPVDVLAARGQRARRSAARLRREAARTGREKNGALQSAEGREERRRGRQRPLARTERSPVRGANPCARRSAGGIAGARRRGVPERVEHAAPTNDPVTSGRPQRHSRIVQPRPKDPVSAAREAAGRAEARPPPRTALLQSRSAGSKLGVAFAARISADEACRSNASPSRKCGSNRGARGGEKCSVPSTGPWAGAARRGIGVVEHSPEARRNLRFGGRPGGAARSDARHEEARAASAADIPSARAIRICSKAWP